MAVIIWTSSDKPIYLRRVAEPVFGVTKTPTKSYSFEQYPDIPQVEEGDVLIAMGNKCLDVLRQYGALPKNRTIKSLREKWHEYPPVPLLVSYDPGLIEIDTGREPEIVYDLQLACRIHDTGTMKPEVGKYKYVKNFDKVIDQIKKAYKKGGKNPVYVAGDLETIGFDPRYKSDIPWRLDPKEPEPEGYYPDARIITISFTVKEGTAYLYRVPEDGIDEYVRRQIDYICTSHKVKTTGANWKFDQLWMLVHWAIKCTNQKFDTGIVGCLIDENRSNSLNLHAKVYTGMGGYDDDFNDNNDKARMDLAILLDPKGFKTYAGGDTDACLQATHPLRKELMKDQRLANFYVNLLQPASDVFTKLEHRGVYVDASRYDELEVQCEAEMVNAHNAGLKMMPRKMRIRFDAEPIKNTEDKLSLTRPTLIKEFLFTKKGLNLKPTQFTEKAKEKTWEYASTSADHLETFKDNEDAAEFIKAYGEFNGAKKTLSTYIIGFKKHLRSDGMFHPSYNLYKGDFGSGDDSGTVTGRTSTRDPAYQCQPGHSLVLTSAGYVPMRQLAHNYEGVRVITHTGEWKTILAVYDNGIQPVYRVITEGGLVVEATGNHPVLTTGGWKEVQYLNTVDRVITYATISEFNGAGLRTFAGTTTPRSRQSGNMAMRLPLRKTGQSSSRKSKIGKHNFVRMFLDKCNASSHPRTDQRQEDSNVSLVGGYEGAMQYPVSNKLCVLRRSRNLLLQGVGVIRKLLSGYGDDADRLQPRTKGCERELLPEELSLDSERGAEPKQAEFSEEQVVSITLLDPVQTWGLTIADSHSYVSDGIVVHNTIPKHTKWASPLRTVYIAPPGMAILKLDYSQGELRVAACVADEPTMIAAYKAGIDMHLKTGAEVYGISLKKALKWKKKNDARIKAIRQGGKAGNFGLLYAMSPAGFVNYAWKTYGVELTLDKAKEFYASFFEMYPGLVDWHENSKSIARQHHEIRNPLGRIRHLPLINSKNYKARGSAERQSINSPIQSCLSDMMLLGMVLVDREYPDLHMFGMTHDEVQIYVPEDEIDLWAKRIGDILSNLPLQDFGWDPQLTFPVDAEWSTTNLAECVAV